MRDNSEKEGERQSPPGVCLSGKNLGQRIEQLNNEKVERSKDRQNGADETIPIEANGLFSEQAYGSKGKEKTQ